LWNNLGPVEHKLCTKCNLSKQEYKNPATAATRTMYLF